jgi:hypothetical protein
MVITLMGLKNAQPVLPAVHVCQKTNVTNALPTESILLDADALTTIYQLRRLPFALSNARKTALIARDPLKTVSLVQINL